MMSSSASSSGRPHDHIVPDEESGLAEVPTTNVPLQRDLMAYPTYEDRCHMAMSRHFGLQREPSASQRDSSGEGGVPGALVHAGDTDDVSEITDETGHGSGTSGASPQRQSRPKNLPVIRESPSGELAGPGPAETDRAPLEEDDATEQQVSALTTMARRILGVVLTSLAVVIPVSLVNKRHAPTLPKAWSTSKPSFATPTTLSPTDMPATLTTSKPTSAKPSMSPTDEYSKATIATKGRTCTNTPGYIDKDGDGCEYYEKPENYPRICRDSGENENEDGETPNENCCICFCYLHNTAICGKDSALETIPSFEPIVSANYQDFIPSPSLAPSIKPPVSKDVQGNAASLGKVFANYQDLIPIPSLAPSIKPAVSKDVQGERCVDTPGFSDMNGDGCGYYGQHANYPQACDHFGEVGEKGTTPNENCCVCKALKRIGMETV